jgi:hypothetical protein
LSNTDRLSTLVLLEETARPIWISEAMLMLREPTCVSVVPFGGTVGGQRIARADQPNPEIGEGPRTPVRGRGGPSSAAALLEAEGAVGGLNGDVVSLAADGGLWHDGVVGFRDFRSASSQLLLASSRKPSKFATIFGDGE